MKEINRVYAKLVDPTRTEKVPVLALFLIWWGYRELDCSKDPKRANPSELIYDWSRAICHDFCVNMKEKTDVVKQIFSPTYDALIFNPKRKERLMKEHFEPFISVSTDAPDADHLNKLFNEKFIKVPGDYPEDEEIIQPLDGVERFNEFHVLPLYMFVKINRFAADPNRKDQRVIRFPKLLDVYSMCDASLQKRIATGRNLHLAEIQKHANSIAAMKGTLPSKK